MIDQLKNSLTSQEYKLYQDHRLQNEDNRFLDQMLDWSQIVKHKDLHPLY